MEQRKLQSLTSNKLEPVNTVFYLSKLLELKKNVDNVQPIE